MMRAIEPKSLTWGNREPDRGLRIALMWREGPWRAQINDAEARGFPRVPYGATDITDDCGVGTAQRRPDGGPCAARPEPRGKSQRGQNAGAALRFRLCGLSSQPGWAGQRPR